MRALREKRGARAPCCSQRAGMVQSGFELLRCTVDIGPPAAVRPCMHILQQLYIPVKLLLRPSSPIGYLVESMGTRIEAWARFPAVQNRLRAPCAWPEACYLSFE